MQHVWGMIGQDTPVPGQGCTAAKAAAKDSAAALTVQVGSGSSLHRGQTDAAQAALQWWAVACKVQTMPAFGSWMLQQMREQL